jgi:hypothetical protein
MNTPHIAFDSTSIGNRLDVRNGSFNVSDSDGNITNIVALNSLEGFNINGTNWTCNVPYGTIPGTNNISFYAQDNNGAIYSTNTLRLISKNTPASFADIVINDRKGRSITNILSGANADGDSLTFYIASQGTNGTGVVVGNQLVYNPSSNAPVVDNVKVRAFDGYDYATNNVFVSTTNTAPSLTGLSLTNLAGTASDIILSGSDPDGDVLSFAIVGSPGKGDLSGSGSNRVYTSWANAFGADSVSFTVNDGFDDSAMAVVDVLVVASNRVPVLSGISVAGGTVTVTGQVQPNREVVLEARDVVSAGSWGGVYTQAVALSTNAFVPYNATLPQTNAIKFFRLKSEAK